MTTQAPPSHGPDTDAWAREAEDRILDAALRAVPAEGFGRAALTRGGRDAGFSEADVELLMPNGAADLAALLSRRHDARALAMLADRDPAALKIRARIRAGCEARIDAAAQDETVLRRMAGFLALPQNLPLAGRLAWESADVLWRWAGDTATDENHYSKRTLLAGILTGALAIRLSSDRAAALAFVDRRIQNVMDFETWKATTRLKPGEAAAALARTLGRMRYGRG